MTGQGPTYVSPGLGGESAVRFDGTGTYLTGSLNGAWTPDLDDFTVIVKHIADPSASGDQFILSNDSGTGTSVHVGRTNSGLWSFTAAWDPAGSIAYTLAQPRVISLVSSSSNAQIYQDGVLQGSKGSSLAGSVDPLAPFTLGAHGSQGSGFYKGDLVEIMVYARALSTSEREAIEQCLLSSIPQPTPTVTPTPEGGGGGMARLGAKKAGTTWLRSDQRLLAVPNPARNDLWLAWRQDRPGNARITAFDLAGSQVRQWSFEGRNAGEHRDRVGVDDLASGIYIIVLEGQSLDGPAVLARGKLAVVR